MIASFDTAEAAIQCVWPDLMAKSLLQFSPLRTKGTCLPTVPTMVAAMRTTSDFGTVIETRQNRSPRS